MLFIGKRVVLIVFLFLSIVFVSCYRNDIQFGTVPENNYTRLVYIDTVEPRLSTLVLDSFITNSPRGFLLGKYKDPYLGLTSAKPFFQMTIPDSTLTFPTTAVYDSAAVIVRLNSYYYGDTTKAITVTANELAQPIDYTYSNFIYNTSNIPIKPTPLGSTSLPIRIRPNVDDSFSIRIDPKGQELFNKLVQRDIQVSSTDNFLNYFKGVSLSVSNNDTSVVYGLGSATGQIFIRIYYHLTTPSFSQQVVDFKSLGNDHSFNQIITDRTNTVLYSVLPGTKIFPSEQTNDIAFTQIGTGLQLKIIFPSLKGILQSNNIVKIIKAELIVKPIGNTYNGYSRLPDSLYLAQTDATNVVGNTVPDSTGNPQFARPVIDNIYGINTYYRFNITPSITTFLNTAGSEQTGFFLLENNSVTGINRAVIGNIHTNYKTQLLLTTAIINK